MRTSSVADTPCERRAHAGTVALFRSAISTEREGQELPASNFREILSGQDCQGTRATTRDPPGLGAAVVAERMSATLAT